MRLLLTILLCVSTGSAYAFEEMTYTKDTFNSTFIYPDLPASVLPPPAGGLVWDVFTTTTEEQILGTGDEANIIKETRPKFSPALEAYDGKIVTMRGYMFPLEETQDQKNFLFGPFPLTCPFHYHTPATLIIEAHATDGIPFTYEDIVLSGRLHLVRGEKNQPYYRMTDTTLQSQSLLEDGAQKRAFHPLYRDTPMQIRKNPEINVDGIATDDNKVK